MTRLRMAERRTTDGPDRGPDRAEPGRRQPSGSGGADDTAATAGRSLPTWVPTDDVIAARPDRQVLVVGTTPTALALAGLLRTAGYDPVLAAGTDPPAASRVAYLPPATVEALGALGLRATVREHGRRVDRVEIRWGDREGDGGGTAAGSPPDEGERAPPVVIPTSVLWRALRRETGAGAAATLRAVASASPGDCGVAVTFEDGVCEWFDVVVDAGGGGAALDAPERAEPTALVQYETSTAGTLPDRGIVESWTPTAAIQRLGGPAATREVARITALTTDWPLGERTRGAGVRSGILEHVDRPASDAFGPLSVRQVRLPAESTPETWWGTNRIARCGPAACPAPPAAGVGPAFGITDALELVRALAREGATAPEAVEAYRTARAGRFERLRRVSTGADRPAAAPASRSGALGALYALRAMAFEPFFGTPPVALAGTDGR